MIILAFPLFFIKDIKFILKLAHAGVFAIGLFVIFIIYIFFDNLASGRMSDNIGELNYFTGNININFSLI